MKGSQTAIDTALVYIALTLSVTSMTLFVISGFEANHEVTVDQRSVSASYVWMYNESSGVARVRDGVQAACVGFTDDECVEASKGRARAHLGEAALRVKGGIQLGQGGPILTTTSDGSELVVEQHHSGTQILRVNLETGGIVVGEGLDTPHSPSVQVNGYSLGNDDRYDSEAWIASEGFDLHALGSNHSYARVDYVCHREDALQCGVRYMASGPDATHSRSIVAMRDYVVLGDAPLAFIQANGPKADLLVFGRAYSGMLRTTNEEPHCTQMPLSDATLDSQQVYQLVKIKVQSCSHPETLIDVSIVDQDEENFVFCRGGQAFFQNTPGGIPLGECARRNEENLIYYCKTTVSNIA